MIVPPASVSIRAHAISQDASQDASRQRARKDKHRSMAETRQCLCGLSFALVVLGVVVLLYCQPEHGKPLDNYRFTVAIILLLLGLLCCFIAC